MNLLPFQWGLSLFIPNSDEEDSRPAAVFFLLVAEVRGRYKINSPFAFLGSRYVDPSDLRHVRLRFPVGLPSPVPKSQT